MKLKTAYARFYKSFNFDHARKLDARVQPQPWEMFRERFYPYVTVELDRRITTVVGANESARVICSVSSRRRSLAMRSNSVICAAIRLFLA